MKQIMKPGHPKWWEFIKALEGPDGCNFREREEDGKTAWNCGGGTDQSLARAILEKMGDIDIESSLAYFTERGGHCDCEILFNVVDWDEYPEEE
jgi:hypothetical protein